MIRDIFYLILEHVMARTVDLIDALYEISGHRSPGRLELLMRRATQLDQRRKLWKHIRDKCFWPDHSEFERLKHQIPEHQELCAYGREQLPVTFVLPATENSADWAFSLSMIPLPPGKEASDLMHLVVQQLKADIRETQILRVSLDVLLSGAFDDRVDLFETYLTEKTLYRTHPDKFANRFRLDQTLQNLEIISHLPIGFDGLKWWKRTTLSSVKVGRNRLADAKLPTAYQKVKESIPHRKPIPKLNNDHYFLDYIFLFKKHKGSPLPTEEQLEAMLLVRFPGSVNHRDAARRLIADLGGRPMGAPTKSL